MAGLFLCSASYRLLYLKEKILNRSGKKIIDRLEHKKANGDESTETADAIKRVSSLMAVTAVQNGIDPNKIDHNDDPKTLINRLKNRFKKKSTTEVIDGHLMTITENSNGEKEIKTGNSDNKEALKKIQEKENGLISQAAIFY